MREYYVYIVTNRSRTLCVGMTGNLPRRVYEHRYRLVPGFTSRYHITQLVYSERFPDVRDAIAAEKRFK